MSESLYVPVSLIIAGAVAWITAGVVFIAVPTSTMPEKLLTAGTGAMALGGTAFQNTHSKPTTNTTRRKKPAKPNSDTVS